MELRFGIFDIYYFLYHQVLSENIKTFCEARNVFAQDSGMKSMFNLDLGCLKNGRLIYTQNAVLATDVNAIMKFVFLFGCFWV